MRCWLGFLLVVVLLGGCGVFRDVNRERHRLELDAKLGAEFVRLDTGKRLVIETWRVFPSMAKPVNGGDISVPALRSLESDIGNMGAILEGSRLTLEQAGQYESGSTTAEVAVDERRSERQATSSWKGVWVWVIGVALVLVFLYVLIRTYLPKIKR